MRRLLCALQLATIVLLLQYPQTHAIRRSSDLVDELVSQYPGPVLLETQESSLEGSEASLASQFSSEASVPDAESGFKQTVMETPLGRSTQLDKVWDTPDEGGSTIVLSNRNSMEAWQPAPKDGTNARLKLMELRVRQARERAEEEAYKQEVELAGNQKLAAIQDEQKSKDNQLEMEKWTNALTASRLRPEWKAVDLLSGKLLSFGNLVKKSDAVTWMLWIKPTGKIQGWGNILHKGDTADERSPLLSFYPATTRLTIRSATSGNANDGANPDPKVELPVGKWTHVAFTHKMGELKVYYNTELVATTADIQPPVSNPGPVSVCGAAQTCASAQIFDVRYFPSALDIDHIAMAAQDSTAKMTQQVPADSASGSSSGSSSSSGSVSSASSGSVSSGSASSTRSSASSASASAAPASSSRFSTASSSLAPRF